MNSTRLTAVSSPPRTMTRAIELVSPACLPMSWTTAVTIATEPMIETMRVTKETAKKYTDCGRRPVGSGWGRFDTTTMISTPTMANRVTTASTTTATSIREPSPNPCVEVVTEAPDATLIGNEPELVAGLSTELPPGKPGIVVATAVLKTPLIDRPSRREAGMERLADGMILQSDSSPWVNRRPRCAFLQPGGDPRTTMKVVERE